MSDHSYESSLGHYQGMQPAFVLEKFFSGKIKGWGLIEDWRGRVITRFDVVMEGRWQGDQGVLEEYFQYYEGKTQKRVWKIQQLSPNSYEGRADDIIGVARGTSAGNAMRWQYRMNIPVKGRNYLISFDDWMYQMNDGVVINRSYLKKFGFTVAELTLFMKKE